MSLLLSTLAHGQTGPVSTGLAGSLKSLEPTELKSQREPQRTDPTRDPLTLLESGQISLRGNVLSSSEPITLRYRDETLGANSFTYDRGTRIANLSEGASLDGSTRRVRAAALRIDLNTDEVYYQDGKATLGPSALGERLRSPLYVTASEGVLSRPGGHALDCTTTTCDQDCPHYALASDSTTVIAGDRVILRNARLKVLGRTILRVPYLSLPLDERPLRQLPEFGETPDEGYYVQVGTASPVSRSLELESTLRYMTKLGTLTSFYLPYRLATMTGTARLATLFGPNRSVNGSVQHDQSLGSGRLSVTGQLQNNNYQTAPQSTNQSVAVGYSVSARGGTTNLSHQTSSSRTAGFLSESAITSLRQNYRIGRLSQDLNLTLRRNESSGTFGQANRFETFDVRYQGELRDPRGALQLEYARTIPVTVSGTRFRSTDTTPQVTLQSDVQRLLRIGRMRHGNASLRMQWGELTNSSDSSRVSRLGFEVASRDRVRLSDFASLDLGNSFNQGVYSDGTAQYSLRNRSTALLGRRDRLFGEIDYTYLRAFGFTPLAIDATGRSDSFGMGLGYSQGRKLSLQLRTGYDVLSSSRGFAPWQSVSFRAESRPTDRHSLALSTLYDSARAQWSTVRVDFEAPILAGQVRGSARYDARRSVWAATLLDIEALKIGKLTASTLLSYNGYRKAFDYRELALVYDLHCTEAVLSFRENNVGFRTGTTIGFSIRIKALPTAGGFGLGTRGQSTTAIGGFRR